LDLDAGRDLLLFAFVGSAFLAATIVTAEPDTPGVEVLEGMGDDVAQTAPQPRQSHAGGERSSPIVQERLGHSSISVTSDICSHLLPNMQGEAAMAVDGALRRAIKKPSDELG
jgi:hypothetical protein